ncbi:hypothetical protein C8R42DRAFT_719992 [Lentinula raphanica]|nr:hypothetical protein C8R42DRAFT_719992 [Lentinula raphanica]
MDLLPLSTGSTKAESRSCMVDESFPDPLASLSSTDPFPPSSGPTESSGRARSSFVSGGGWLLGPEEVAHKAHNQGPGRPSLGEEAGIGRPIDLEIEEKDLRFHITFSAGISYHIHAFVCFLICFRLCHRQKHSLSLVHHPPQSLRTADINAPFHFLQQTGLGCHSHNKHSRRLQTHSALPNKTLADRVDRARFATSFKVKPTIVQPLTPSTPFDFSALLRATIDTASYERLADESSGCKGVDRVADRPTSTTVVLEESFSIACPATQSTPVPFALEPTSQRKTWNKSNSKRS